MIIYLICQRFQVQLTLIISSITKLEPKIIKSSKITQSYKKFISLRSNKKHYPIFYDDFSNVLVMLCLKMWAKFKKMEARFHSQLLGVLNLQCVQLKPELPQVSAPERSIILLLRKMALSLKVQWETSRYLKYCE